MTDRKRPTVRRWISRLASVVLVCGLGGPSALAQSDRRTGETVDLVLALAVDISLSMTPEELRIQREGYAEAIVSKSVLDAIRGGGLGRIAVAYVEWAGADEQRLVAGWTVIDDEASARAFAARLMAAPRRRHFYRTSISSALRYAARHVERSGFEAPRRVIDISGDGPNNEGEPVTAARDDIVGSGIVINGLPLVINQPPEQLEAIGGIDDYYRACVIGGVGSFAMPVGSIEQFKEAVRTKLLAEIAGLADDALPPPTAEPVVTAAAARKGRGGIDCEAAEELWRKRYDR